MMTIVRNRPSTFAARVRGVSAGRVHDDVHAHGGHCGASDVVAGPVDKIAQTSERAGHEDAPIGSEDAPEVPVVLEGGDEPVGAPSAATCAPAQATRGALGHPAKPARRRRSRQLRRGRTATSERTTDIPRTIGGRLRLGRRLTFDATRRHTVGPRPAYAAVRTVQRPTSQGSSCCRPRAHDKSSSSSEPLPSPVPVAGHGGDRRARFGAPSDDSVGGQRARVRRCWRPPAGICPAETAQVRADGAVALADQRDEPAPGVECSGQPCGTSTGSPIPAFAMWKRRRCVSTTR